MATVIRGTPRTKENIRRIAQAVRRGVISELEDYANDLLELSRDYAPQLTGQMILNSGVDRQDRKNGVAFSVFYREKYALYQHEGFYNPGPVTAAKPSAGRKFLERAYNQTRRQRLERIAKRTQREIRLALR